MAVLHHWNYFLAIEADLDHLSRYVEFAPANYTTYSTELAHLLMTATQETDVLLHLLCAHSGDASANERSYRGFLPGKYPKLVTEKVQLGRWEIEFQPFISWAAGRTPPWWTANNKVKHERATHYTHATLEATLMACSALMLAAIFYYDTQNLLAELWPAPRLLFAGGLFKSITPTAMGLLVNYAV
jgi:hypothetical protein